ncbi:partial 30S ribosomal protein S1, partial [Anaerolineae bacterium]
VEPLLGKQGGFKQLSWDDGTLYFSGRMPYNLRNELREPTKDRTYRRSIDDLYRFSNQLNGETVDAEWCARISGKYPIGTQVTKAKVHRLATFGVFVELEPGVEGLVHKNEMPQNKLGASVIEIAVGEMVDVRVIKVDCEKQQIGLSMLLEDPLAKYKPGDRIRRKVTKVTDYGAFVEIEPGINGLVHKSKMWGRPADATKVVSVGEEKDVLIVSIDLQNRKIELSMEIPENDPILKYQEGYHQIGIVTKIMEYGAFIELEPGISGMVHKSEISWDYVTNINDKLEVGQQVQVLIVGIDREKRRLSLSIKQAN